MSTLFITAGGGGDAVGALLAHRLLDPASTEPALIATCAWERLRIDPTPGPRHRSGFVGLGIVGSQSCEVLPTTDTSPPGRSTLPRLASEGSARVFLFDFAGGARGLTDQLAHLARALDVQRFVLVDVGGDVIGHPGDPHLLSPLADSLTLVATLALGVPTTLAVLAPGADGELPESTVRERLIEAGAELAGHLTPEDVNRCRPVLSWHPTEASAIAAAAALGSLGAVDMRRGGTPTPITEHTSELWTLDNPDLEFFPLARELSQAATLEDVEAILRPLAGSEIDFERQKANRAPTAHAPLPLADAARNAQASGATFITSRRLAEVAQGHDLDSTSTESARLDGLGLWRLDRLRSAAG